jgi:hypothetical protein
MSAIYDEMCRTGADTTFERLFEGYRKLGRLNGAQSGLGERSWSPAAEDRPEQSVDRNV